MKSLQMMGWFVPACVVVLSAAGCGGGSSDSKAATGSSAVKGEHEVTKDGVTGPGPALISTWLTSKERTGVRLIPESWTITELEITEWTNDGDEVDPFIRGNFKGRAKVNETLYEIKDWLPGRDSFSTEDLRVERQGDLFMIVGQHQSEGSIWAVEIVHEGGKSVEIHGKFTSTKLAGEWVPVPDASSGRPGLLLTFLGENPFQRTGIPRSQIESDTILISGSDAEREHREFVEKRRQAYEEAFKRVFEEQSRLQKELAAEASKAAARTSAEYFREKTPEVAKAVGNGKVWVSDGELSRDILTVIRLDSWDAETGTATGETFVLGPLVPYRWGGWGLHRTVTAQIERRDGVRLVVVEGSNLSPSPQSTQPPVTLQITLSSAGDRLTANYSRGSNRGTIGLRLVEPESLTSKDASFAAMPVGQVLRFTFPTSDGADPERYSASIECFARVQALNVVIGRVRTTDSSATQSVRDRFFMGRPDGPKITLFEYGSGSDDAGSRDQYKWVLDFDQQGNVVSGEVFLHHTELAQYRRPLKVVEKN